MVPEGRGHAMNRTHTKNTECREGHGTTSVLEKLGDAAKTWQDRIEGQRPWNSRATRKNWSCDLCVGQVSLSKKAFGEITSKAMGRRLVELLGTTRGFWKKR